MRMRGRGQAPASFLLGSLHEVRGSSRVEARAVACSAVARRADGATTCSLYGRTGGVRGARNLLGSLVSTFGHFLRGTLSSDSLGTPYFLGFCSLYCPRYPVSCARNAQKLLSPERVVPKLPVKPRAAPRRPSLCALRPRAGADGPPFASCEARSSAGASPVDDA